jgi:uncharacterized membrane protein
MEKYHVKTKNHGGKIMKTSDLIPLIKDYGNRFLIADTSSWGIILGFLDADTNDLGGRNLLKEKKISFETHTRAWLKSIVWRLFGIVILGAISWSITHSWKEMSLITIFFHSIRVVLYYLHERIWDRIHWGKIKHPLSVLPVRKALDPEDLELVRDQLQKLGYLD